MGDFVKLVSKWYILFSFSLVVLLGGASLQAAGPAPAASALTKKRAPASEEESQKAQELVNKHLLDTQNRMELNKARVKIENFRHLQPFNNTKKKVMVKTAPDVDLVQEDPSKYLPKEDSGASHVSPTQETYEAMSQAQKDEQYKKEYERQFVKEYKKNAERSGYKVQVDQDLKVRNIQSSPAHSSSQLPPQLPPPSERQPQSLVDPSVNNSSAASGPAGR